MLPARGGPGTGARQERQRHEDEPGVALARGDDVRDVGEGDAARGGQEHQPEMARVMLPVQVELRPHEQKNEADDWEREEEHPRPRGPGRRPLPGAAVVMR